MTDDIKYAYGPVPYSPTLETCPECGGPKIAGEFIHNWTCPKASPTKWAADPADDAHKVLPVGWVCPRCGVVNGPHIAQCSCPPPTTTSTTGTEVSDD